MAHPLREHVERHARGDGVDAVAVAQALRAAVRPVRDPRRVQDRLDAPPGGVARPGPQEAVGMPFPTPLRLPDAVHEVELVQEAGRRRHGPVDALTALLEGFDNDGLPGQVDPLRRERQGLGDAAAGIVQHGAEGAHRALGLGGCRHEGAPLVGAEVEAVSLSVVQHAGTEYMRSVPRASRAAGQPAAKALIRRAA